MKNRLLFTLPNCITLGNLACGCAATVFALSGDVSDGGRLDLVFWFIACAAILDFADGMVARLTGQYSKTGLHLDSLADVVSFGVAPSALLFRAYLCSPSYWNIPQPLSDALGWAVFVVALFSALRLAKFNVIALEEEASPESDPESDPVKKSDFSGLPTPAAALAIAALGAIWFRDGFPAPRELILLVAIAVSCLLICPLRMFSLKFNHFGWHGNEFRYIFISLSAILVALFGIGGVPLAVALYIVISAVRQKFN